MSDWEGAIELAKTSWGKNSLQRNGKYCALGIIGMVTLREEALTYHGLEGNLEAHEMINSVAKVIREQYPEFYEGNQSYDEMDAVWKWNDRKCTSKEELIAVFEKASMK